MYLVPRSAVTANSSALCLLRYFSAWRSPCLKPLTLRLQYLLLRSRIKSIFIFLYFFSRLVKSNSVVTRFLIKYRTANVARGNAVQISEPLKLSWYLLYKLCSHEFCLTEPFVKKLFLIQPIIQTSSVLPKQFNDPFWPQQNLFPVLGSLRPVLSMKVKQGMSTMWLFSSQQLYIESSQQGLFISVLIGLFKKMTKSRSSLLWPHTQNR